MGSIVGTFLGGFVLLAWFGVTTILFGVAACLLAASLMVRLHPLLPRAVLALLLLAGMAADTLYSVWLADNALARGLPVIIETAYSSVRVTQGMQGGRLMRLLFTDPGSCQSGMFEDTPQDLAFDYTRFYGLGTGMKPDAKRILMLGGGGYSVPKWLLAGKSGLAAQDFQLDVVELDPGMTKAAQRYFAAPEKDSRMRIYHEDARVFINRISAKMSEDGFGPYDLIFADIFNSWYSVPFHVGTREAAQRIRTLLAEDGLYIMNIITAVNGDNGRLLRSVRNAFAEVFRQVHVFPVQSKYNGALVQNVMLLAFRSPRALPDPMRERVAPHLTRLLDNLWTTPFPSPAEDVQALTDNFSPVERYTLNFSRK